VPAARCGFYLAKHECFPSSQTQLITRLSLLAKSFPAKLPLTPNNVLRQALLFAKTLSSRVALALTVSNK
jgi:hypothetical protein